MRQSRLFTKTSKEAPKEEPSRNAELLIRAGFVDKLMAGTYTFLPLGLRTLDRIKDIIRQEIDAIGGQEVLMPALSPIENYKKTGRDGLDILFRTKLASGSELLLNQSHEEVVVPLVKKFVRSYKDLPVAVYQIQDKFRNELRAKSGLLRGREFSMKDLYSFHETQEDFEAYYEKARQAYANIFERCGLQAKYTEASGGTFSKLSHEFQVLTPSGEDTVYFCDSCDFCQNREIFEGKAGQGCSSCGKGTIREDRAIEVGNIFPLKDKFTKAFDLKFTNRNGELEYVIMGCYGIGPSRVMGTIAEIHNDERGLLWPASVAPLSVHLLELSRDPSAHADTEELYGEMQRHGIDVLLDDRADVSAGEKLAEADLIGLPVRLVMSDKTREQESTEIKLRKEKKAELIKTKDTVKQVESLIA